MSKQAYDPFNIYQAASDPSFPTPKYGDVYRNTSTGALRYYTGTAWADLPYPITVNSVAPGSPAQAAVWLDTTSPGLDPTAYQISNRNATHNGGMRVAQRGTSGAGSTNATTGLNGLDRWMAYRAGFVAGMTWTQIAASLPSGFANSCRVQRDNANAATGALWITQTHENESSTKFQGQPVVVSFWAKAGANYSAASSLLNVNIVSGTGTEVTAVTTSGPAFVTGNTTEISTNVTLTTAWQKFVIADLGLAAGLTQIALSFGYTPVGTASTNDWFEITGVQMEVGYAVTPFEARPLQQDLAICQRYLWKISRSNGSASPMMMGMPVSGSTERCPLPLPVPMRSDAPNAAIGGTMSSLGGGGTGTVSALSCVEGALQGVVVIAFTSSVTHTSSTAVFVYGTTSTTLTLSAEI